MSTTENRKDLLGPTEPDSPAGRKLESMISSAEKALADVDAAELFNLFKEAVKERGEALKTLTLLAAHYVGDSKTPRFTPSDNAIESMERIALAAIDLASSVVHKNDAKTGLKQLAGRK